MNPLTNVCRTTSRLFFFFFQAEDGIRDLTVTGVQTCALPISCTFCATGAMAFGRNLTAWEILDQALHFRRLERVDHCVFMGMGEPMLNLDEEIGRASCRERV